ncbi:Tad domain-containing protein [Sphingorhabdus sp.]|uniref:Tad domain-containing protein n=1 Tax=Sphingorhabdus sp. TaxID=1902408 RepID=UPI0038FCE7E1
MTKHLDAKHSVGIMSRLASNQEGNIIAIFAAAIIPAIGLVGGAVDMSRLYLTQARLQGACDAGALLGRKTMGVGTWAANNNVANAQAIRMFDQNFESGAYGSTGLTRVYTESGGNVVGTASVAVPMALMQVFGQSSTTVSVSCQAELRLPNTDVMFVLDATGSMGDPAEGSAEPKISGLRRAVKCFYEALAKQNIVNITPADCGETSDPVNTNSPNVQLRFGFVPYAMNVNVGRLLPQDYLADQWTYQSREATTIQIPGSTPIFGTESFPTPISAVVTSLADTIWFNTRADIKQNNVTYGWFYRPSTAAACDGRAIPSVDTTPTIDANTLISQAPAQPVEPDSSLTKTYQRDTLNAMRTYQYLYTGNRNDPAGTGDCILQVKATRQTNTRVTTTTVTPITWVTTRSVAAWAFKPVTFNVRGLKGANGSWASSVSLPLGTDGAMTPITWAGCIEERQTFRGPDLDPTNDWDPIPASALDMNIDLAPTDDVTTKWGPYLNTDAIWQRYDIGTDIFGNNPISTNTRTLNTVVISQTNVDTLFSNSQTRYLWKPDVSSCPTSARTVKSWPPADFNAYVDSLTIDGTTYHDIGLLWGARLMSPTGIFAALNAPPNVNMERHMIFMTDGETVVGPSNYSAYGIHRYDRRQTPLDSEPTQEQLVTMTNARTAALCTAIKNKNINLWVVSYGPSGDIGQATNDRLRACATPGKFFEARSVASLISNFKGIAAEISALRMTK